MIIIRRKSDNIVTHAGDNLQLQDSGLWANNSWNPTLNTSTCDQIEVSDLPPYFQGNAWIYTDQDGFQLAKQEPLEQAKMDKMAEVEVERVRRTEQMPFTIPSSGTSVQVKIAEQPPSKPRQTWLSGASSRALAAKVESSTMTEDMIAADDTRHSMNEDDWVQLGKELHNWVRAHIDAASQHMADIQGYTTVDEVQGHNLTLYWP